MVEHNIKLKKKYIFKKSPKRYKITLNLLRTKYTILQTEICLEISQFIYKRCVFGSVIITYNIDSESFWRRRWVESRDLLYVSVDPWVIIKYLRVDSRVIMSRYTSDLITKYKFLKTFLPKY